MGRVKLKIKRLESVTSRNTTYSKRRNGILKKARELSILCDVDILLLMFSPTGKPTLFHGERSNLEEVITKFSQHAPQERAKRKLEGLEALRKTFKKLEHDVNVEEFLGTSTQTIEGVNEQIRTLHSELSNAQRRLCLWVNPNMVESIEHIELMQETVRASLARINIHKECKMKQRRTLLDGNQYQNEMMPPLVMNPNQQQWMGGNVHDLSYLQSQREIEFSADMNLMNYHQYCMPHTQMNMDDFQQSRATFNQMGTYNMVGPKGPFNMIGPSRTFNIMGPSGSMTMIGSNRAFHKAGPSNSFYEAGPSNRYPEMGTYNELGTYSEQGARGTFSELDKRGGFKQDDAAERFKEMSSSLFGETSGTYNMFNEEEDNIGMEGSMLNEEGVEEEVRNNTCEEMVTETSDTAERAPLPQDEAACFSLEKNVVTKHQESPPDPYHTQNGSDYGMGAYGEGSTSGAAGGTPLSQEQMTSFPFPNMNIGNEEIKSDNTQLQGNYEIESLLRDNTQHRAWEHPPSSSHPDAAMFDPTFFNQ